VTQKLDHKPIAPHTDKPMDRMHWSPFTRVRKGARPGQGVQIVRVEESSVHVEQDARPLFSRHVMHPFNWSAGIGW
jgi:hypothetical protein